MELKVYTLLGRAGCGKGTQAKLLTEKFGLIYIGSGDLLRKRVKQNDFTGQKTGQTMKTGALVPTSLIFMLWIDRLEKIKQGDLAELKGIIFDGSPRKLIEEELLEEALGWYEWDRNYKAILIDISRQEAFDRLTKRRQCAQCGQLIPYIGAYKTLEKCDKCGGELLVRQDDTPEAINLRLDLFEKEVAPVIEHFAKKGTLVKINGEQPIEDVQREILSKIA
ncbi:MAG: nucleoside monophosphate kinase [Candidatus Portnoybacteria bacterium]|nr:nucleoside monophosphate kinase [Candidatus Portnoybacteria bacterium]MDD4982565.1 nucleoside monophosphate kinase [Candidatus Portnoybacteria bacterium]